MQQRLLIAAVILLKRATLIFAVTTVFLLGVGAETVRGDALGLTDGNYAIHVDIGLGPTIDATLTIGPTPLFVTSFHGSIFDCTGCDVGSPGNPDVVETNDGSEFRINDATGAGLKLVTAGSATFFFPPCDGICLAALDGSWTARAVPEPMTSTLLLLGIGALGLRQRLRSNQS